MPYCSQCQIIHGEEHRFCQRCGQLLKSGPTALARPCTRCGNYTFPGQKFCTECGLPLRVAMVQDEAEIQEPPPLFYPRRANNVVRRRERRPGRFLSILGVIFIVIAGYYVWQKFTTPRIPSERLPAATAPQEDLTREVKTLLEKIRSAHLSKDINKWLSCYNQAYPNLGGLEGQMLELWKKYDIKEVSYHVANVKKLSDRQASADIVWNIQLYDLQSHDYDLMRLSYRVILENGPGGWKIRDSKEEAGGSS